MASIDGKLSNVQGISSLDEIDTKRALLRELPREFDKSAEKIMECRCGYHKAVAKLLVRETRLNDSKMETEKASIAQKETKRCFAWDKPEHFARECRNHKGSKLKECEEKRK